jgi:hypothetical protein
VRDALERRDLFGAGLAPAGRHVGFLIPGEKRGRAVNALDFQEGDRQGLQRLQGLHSRVSPRGTVML